MEIHSYNAELAFANLMFTRLFRNIIIERNDENGQLKQFTVNCVLGQRSRILKNFQNPNKMATIKLPMIIINRTGIFRNSDRLNNLHNEVKYQSSTKNINYNLYSPVPVDLSYEVTIVSKLPGDIDKILSNFICFFNNDLFVSCIHPKYTNLVLNNQVILEDTINEELPDELDATQDDFQIATLSFKFKTYLFNGPDKTNSDDASVVQKLSTYLSTWTEISTDSVGNVISTEVSAELSSLIDVVYDGFVPQINTIYAGFYPVPKQEEFVSYINKVDNYPDSSPYVDRIIWKIDSTSDAEFPANIKWYNGNYYQ